MSLSPHAECVLIMNNDQAIRKVLHEILSKEGYDVREAENGAQALDVMQSTPPDVVVLNLMMPEFMSGWEVLAATDEEEKLRRRPILGRVGDERSSRAPRWARGGTDVPGQTARHPRLAGRHPLDHDPGRLHRDLLDARPTEKTPAPPSVGTAREALRLLLVEDSEDDKGILIVRTLHQGGFAVTARRVINESQFASALDTGDWDVVLSDFSLPSFNGRAALDVVQGRGIDIPFIIVSGMVGEDTAVQVMKAGAHDFFTKGNLERLPSAVRREVRTPSGARPRSPNGGARARSSSASCRTSVKRSRCGTTFCRLRRTSFERR